MCLGYSDLTLPSLLAAPAAMLTVSGRDDVDRPTHEICAELDVSILTTMEYVRARRYATTGRTGLGLHDTARAELRSIGSRRTFTKDLTGAGRGPDLVGHERLTCYAIGTTGSADHRGISTGPSSGRAPEQTDKLVLLKT